jgi:hypothetical protein
MTTLQRFIGIALKGSVVTAVAALVLAGCATVDLEPDTGGPQVQMPGDAPVNFTPSGGTPPQDAPSAQTMPVAPAGAVTQPLPPPDNTAGNADAPGAAGVPNTNAMPDANASGASVMPPANTNAHLVTLTINLDSASAAPPTPSGATAHVDLLYDSNSRLLRWIATWGTLSGPITGVSFYGPAAPGQQGPATLIWPGPFGPRYEGRATLTPQQAADLMGGLWYLNISTVSYPAGEIRGQVRAVY